MKKLLYAALVSTLTVLWWVGINSATQVSAQQAGKSIEDQKNVFKQSIPAVANQYIGTPYQFGGNPLESGTSDNSNLFFTIYTLAAKKAGLVYSEYLPMKFLLARMEEVDENNLQNGDLIVLNNHLAAMIYRIENTGKIHLIYASEKRQKVLSFNSDNLVFNIYWLENLKGFYRLPDAMLAAADQ